MLIWIKSYNNFKIKQNDYMKNSYINFQTKENYLTNTGKITSLFA